MIPVFNSVPHRPPKSYGDCFRACLSSILERELPHVLHDGCDGVLKLARINEELYRDGLAYLEIPLMYEQVSDVLAWGDYVTQENRIHYLLLGTTFEGIGHYVVCHGSEIIHNPDKAAMIVRPFDDGAYWLGFVVHRT